MEATIPLLVLIVLALSHYIADFLLQTNWMAVNKSSNLKALTLHVGIYSIVFIPFGIVFVAITFITHWLTDLVTSKIAAHFAKNEKRSAMFRTIGADQMIHAITLYLTYVLVEKYDLFILALV